MNDQDSHIKWLMESKTNETLIYFVECAGFVKIGSTFNIRRRMAAFECGNPLPLRLLGWLKASKDLEVMLHVRFMAYAVPDRMEWFTLSDSIVEFIHKFSNAGDPPTIFTERSVRRRSTSQYPELTREERERNAALQTTLQTHTMKT